MDSLETTLLQANERRFHSAPAPLKSHGPDHHWRVYQHALKLASVIDAPYDKVVLAGATLLHDMAAYYPDKTGDAYHDFDDKIAKEVLHEIGFPADKIQPVLYAIAHHGSDPKYRTTTEPIEVTLLRDADKLDVFGPVGVARIIMARTLKGDTLAEIIDDFWTRGHLERKWESITLDQARKLAKDDYAYSRAFFGQLAAELTS